MGYYLQRASAAGRSLWQQPFAVYPVAERVLRSLRKVYRSRNLKLTLEADDSVQFAGDEGDFMEILGNLADNACKWADQDVTVRICTDARHQMTLLVVIDDGPGIASERLKNCRSAECGSTSL